MRNDRKQLIDRKETVLVRDDQIYAENLEDLMEMFRAMQNVLEELGFDEIEEDYSEHWETLPFKAGIDATMWRDPYTAIILDIGPRVKNARSDRRTHDDIYKVKLKLKAQVVRYRYPRTEHMTGRTRFQHTPFYRWIRKFLNSWLFEKQLEKYREEAEHLGLEFMSRMREIEGTIPSIGRGKQEYYNPNDPR